MNYLKLDAEVDVVDFADVVADTKAMRVCLQIAKALILSKNTESLSLVVDVCFVELGLVMFGRDD